MRTIKGQNYVLDKVPETWHHYSKGPILGHHPTYSRLWRNPEAMSLRKIAKHIYDTLTHSCTTI